MRIADRAGEARAHERRPAVDGEQERAQDGADRVEIDRQLDQIDDGADGKIERRAKAITISRGVVSMRPPLRV